MTDHIPKNDSVQHKLYRVKPEYAYGSSEDANYFPLQVMGDLSINEFIVFTYLYCDECPNNLVSIHMFLNKHGKIESRIINESLLNLIDTGWVEVMHG